MQSQKIKQKPKKNEVELIPYCEIDGIRTFQDSEILTFYDRMEQEGTAQHFFNGGNIANREQWLRFMKKPENFLYVVYADKKLASLCWLNQVKTKSAYIHFCSFNNGLMPDDKISVGKQVMDIFINKKTKDNDFVFDVLIGTLLSSNQIAVQFVQKIGFKIAGEIPNGVWNNITNKSEPLVLSYFVRENENI